MARTTDSVDSVLLEQINSPADLRRLDLPQLERLAAELREFVVHAVAINAGPLRSNLRAVELTLAIHPLFDSPRHLILWATGHHPYVHKLVTGLREGPPRLL